MAKQLFLAVGCLALLTMFTSAAMADHVTINVVNPGNATCINSNQTFNQSCGAGVPSGAIVTVINSHGIFTIPMANTAFNGANGTNYTIIPPPPAPPLSATASYSGTSMNNVTQVILSQEGFPTFCANGSGFPYCLTGTNNTGRWIAFQGGVGAFSGIFDLTFVNPNFLAMIGDAGQHALPTGSDSFTTVENSIATTSTISTFGSGSISFQTTAVPEPGTFLMLGSGMLGLAGVLRRKLMR